MAVFVALFARRFRVLFFPVRGREVSIWDLPPGRRPPHTRAGEDAGGSCAAEMRYPGLQMVVVPVQVGDVGVEHGPVANIFSLLLGITK